MGGEGEGGKRVGVNIKQAMEKSEQKKKLLKFHWVCMGSNPNWILKVCRWFLSILSVGCLTFYILYQTKGMVISFLLPVTSPLLPGDATHQIIF